MKTLVIALLLSLAAPAVYAGETDDDPQTDPCPQNNDQAHLLHAFYSEEVEQTCDTSTQENHAFLETQSNFQTSSYRPYLLSMSPEATERLEGHDLQQARIWENMRDWDDHNRRWSPYFDNYAGFYSDPAIRGENLPSRGVAIQRYRRIIEEQYTADPDAEKLRATSSISCGNSIVCRMAYGDMIDTMGVGRFNNGEGNAISRVPAMERIATDPDYIVPILELSRRVQTKVEHARNTGGSIDSGDVWSDLIGILQAQGKNQADAQRMALDIMGLMGTRGAAAGGLFELAENVYESIGPGPAFAISSLGLIASGMNYLDARSPAGRQYSMPPNMQTSCDYTRPYHFWMTAYLGQEMRAKGYPAHEVFRASHGLITMYERFAPVATNANMGDGEPPPAHRTETQKDIIYHDLGMTFGLYPDGNYPDGMVDTVLENSFTQAEERSHNPPGRLSRTVSGAASSLMGTITGRNFSPSAFGSWNYYTAADEHVPTLLENLPQNIYTD